MNVADIRRSLRDTRDATVVRLHMEGQTQRQIAQHIGLSHTTISLILKTRTPQGEVEVPQWVLPEHVETYRIIAVDDGEEAAASWARNAKRQEQQMRSPRAGA